MSFSIAQLRAATDEQLIALHDAVAINTQVGVNFYLDELRRREQQRAIAASHKLAVASFWLTAANAVLAIAAVVIALLA